MMEKNTTAAQRPPWIGRLCFENHEEESLSFLIFLSPLILTLPSLFLNVNSNHSTNDKSPKKTGHNQLHKKCFIIYIIKNAINYL
jgi:hypothetical protein